MNAFSIPSLCLIAASCVPLAAANPAPAAQSGAAAGQSLAVIDGNVRDSADHPVAGAAVSLDTTDPSQTVHAITDSLGHFHFDVVPAGACTLRATSDGFLEAREGPFTLRPGEAKSIVFRLTRAQHASPSKDASSSIEFSDEPQFTVAGMTDTTALGVHGSDRVMRNREAMSKDAVALARKPSDAAASTEAESALRASLAAKETADAHFQLAEIEESQGRALDAAKDYQRAAELQPTEPYLFAWGAELLLHRASEPAAEVFSKGRRLYPQSVRMSLGFGAALYARDLQEEAGKVFLQASDLDPADPAPYLFLGRLQETERRLPSAWVDRMKRFVDLHPENGTAHCLYAAALARQVEGRQNSDAIESQLKTALALDPHLGAAYLQLGIFLAQRHDYPAAMDAYRKAIENTAFPDEAHYRLADAYRRVGDLKNAAAETERFKQVSEQKERQADRERHEIPQFVYTLRSQAAPPAPAPRPH